MFFRVRFALLGEAQKFIICVNPCPVRMLPIADFAKAALAATAE
jgi:hypothetical protein